MGEQEHVLHSHRLRVVRLIAMGVRCAVFHGAPDYESGLRGDSTIDKGLRGSDGRGCPPNLSAVRESETEMLSGSKPESHGPNQWSAKVSRVCSLNERKNVNAVRRSGRNR